MIEKTLAKIMLIGFGAASLYVAARAVKNSIDYPIQQNPSTEYSFMDGGVKGRGSTYVADGQSLPIVSGDFDGDGLVDILLVDNKGDMHIHKNLGGGEFKDCGIIGTIDQYDGQVPYLTVDDFNNDGKLDVATVNKHGNIKIYENRTIPK